MKLPILLFFNNLLAHVAGSSNVYFSDSKIKKHYKNYAVIRSTISE